DSAEHDEHRQHQRCNVVRIAGQLKRASALRRALITHRTSPPNRIRCVESIAVPRRQQSGTPRSQSLSTHARIRDHPQRKPAHRRFAPWLLHKCAGAKPTIAARESLIRRHLRRSGALRLKSLLLGAVGALALVGPAQANGWYVGLEGGASWVDDTD